MAYIEIVNVMVTNPNACLAEQGKPCPVDALEAAMKADLGEQSVARLILANSGTFTHQDDGSQVTNLQWGGHAKDPSMGIIQGDCKACGGTMGIIVK